MTTPSKIVPISSVKVKPADAEPDVEYGIGNVMPGGSWQDWSGGPSAQGTYTIGRDANAPSIDELVAMGRKDGQARALFNLLTLPIRASLEGGEWKAPEGEDPEGATIKFANDMWNMPPQGGGMTVPKSKFLRQSLLSLLHGFAPFEHVRHVCPAGPNKGKITIRKMAYRDPRTVYFVTDTHGDYEGFRQITSFSDRTVNVVIPAEKTWYFAANEEENPFYGVSYFEPALDHYQIKRKLYYISHIAAQFAAVPGRLGILPAAPQAGQMENFRRALQNFAFNTSMLVPFGYDVKPFQASGQFDFLKLIDHHNTMMAASILAKFLQQDDRQVLIDNGKGDASADMFVQMLQAVTNELAESWSHHVMPQYIDYNFSGSKAIYPEFHFAPLSDDQKADLIAMFNAIVVATSLNCTPEFVRQTEEKLAKTFNYDIDYEKIAAAEKKAQEAQAEQQKQQAAQAQQMPPGQPGLPGAQQPGAAAPSAPTAPSQPTAPTAPTAPQLPVAASALDSQDYVSGIDELVIALSQLAAAEDEEVDFANLDG